MIEGERVVFQVEVTGSPQPRLRWYHDGEEVVADYSNELGDDGSLTMPSAETKHSGVYQLVASNPAGRAEREVRLTVEGKKEELTKSSAEPPPSTTAIPVAHFGNHVEQCHFSHNHAFKGQYKVHI